MSDMEELRLEPPRPQHDLPPSHHLDHHCRLVRHPGAERVGEQLELLGQEGAAGEAVTHLGG